MKPGDLREVLILENLERMSKRPESRVDIQRFFEKLPAVEQTYFKHLVTSGPSSVKAAAKACSLEPEQIEAAIQALEAGIAKLKS